MALTYNQITAITRNKFIPKLFDNIFLGNPLLRKLKSSSMRSMDGGEKILIPLEYAELSASDWYSGADTLDTTDNETFTAAEVAWKQLHASISISRLDELKNAGDSQVVDFVKSKVKNAEKKMAKQLSTGVYSDGSDADSIVGLRKWVNADETVGGINQSTNSWWQAQEDTSTTTLSISALQTQYNAASEDNEQPSYGVATKANYNRYYALLQPQQRFTSSEEGKAGFTSLMFIGIPIVSDTNCPANYLFLLNLNHLHFMVHKQENMRFSAFESPIEVGRLAA